MIEIRGLLYALAFGGLLYYLFSPGNAFAAISPAQPRRQSFMQPVKMSAHGLNALKREEALRLMAYQDVAGHWTIGYGHKIVPGDGLSPQSVISRQQASDLLANDLATAEEAVRSSVSVPISQPQFDALVSLAYNIGGGNFRRSDVLKYLNAGDYKTAQASFKWWRKAGGKVVKGLVARRAREAAMFGSA